MTDKGTRVSHQAMPCNLQCKVTQHGDLQALALDSITASCTYMFCVGSLQMHAPAARLPSFVVQVVQPGHILARHAIEGASALMCGASCA